MKIKLCFIAILLFILSCKKSDTSDNKKHEQNKILIVNASNLSLRESPDRKSKVLLSLFKGRIVEVVEETDKTETIDGITSRWINVATRDGTTGYVFGGYLSNQNHASLHTLNTTLKILCAMIYAKALEIIMIVQLW